ncbi:MAG: restriction endonuclease subunit S [Candidatus Woesearchaeota archaeon]
MAMQVKKIDDIFNFEKGKLQSSKNVPGDYIFITAAADWKTHESYTHECEALIFAHGAEGSLGRTHYIDNEKFIASDLCYVITPKEEYVEDIDLYFYYIYFNSIKDRIKKDIATGTSKKAINQTNFSKYEVIFPDIDFQKEFKLSIKKISSLIDIYKENIDNLEKLKTSIFQEAFYEKMQEYNL